MPPVTTVEEDAFEKLGTKLRKEFTQKRKEKKKERLVNDVTCVCYCLLLFCYKFFRQAQEGGG
jgi:hypothetical protein